MCYHRLVPGLFPGILPAVFPGLCAVGWGGGLPAVEHRGADLCGVRGEGSRYGLVYVAFGVFRAFFAVGTVSVMALNIVFTANGVADWVFLVIVAVYQMVVTVVAEQLEKRAEDMKKMSTLTEEVE